MSVSIKMSARDKASFNKDIKQYAKKLEISRDNALDTLALYIQHTAMNILEKNGTNNVGRLKTSIEFHTPRKGTRRIGTTVGYGMYIEFGKRPGTWPKVDDLKRWVRRKLKVNKKQLDWVTYNIGKKIYERGTKAQPFLMPAFQREKKRMILEIRKAIK